MSYHEIVQTALANGPRGSREGLHIIDLDNPYSPPRHLSHRTPWEVADVQWSPFSSRDSWIVSTSNQKALVWNLAISTAQAPIEHVLHAHTRAITDINFSAHNPDMLATCAVDSFIHIWDLRYPARPAMTFADWFAGATQVKYNRQDAHVIASSHDRFLHIWDDRNGSKPLRTIEAHATKIYGIDWSRTSSTSLLTCSLDMTVKLWEYPEVETNPRNMIKVPYPIWRARHTPFGCGILVMPQRGDNDLHLYDQRLAGGREALYHDASPIHSFSGHENPVKEFLWRSRGASDDDTDAREFQLVSWGTDRTLILHRIGDVMLNKVGHHRGQRADARISFTRKGATYKSFRDAPMPAQLEQGAGPSTVSGLSNAIGQALIYGMRRVPPPMTAAGARPSTRVRSGMQVKKETKKRVSPITWMKGVKINKSNFGTQKEPGSDAVNFGISSLDTADGLGDEITHVGNKYKKVVFEQIDVSGRLVVISLNGPWGLDSSLVHVKISIRFPDDYPSRAPCAVEIEKTASISMVTYRRLTFGARTITQAYADHGKGSLDVVTRYLLGETDVQESTALLDVELPSGRNTPDLPDVDSSSDESDAIGPRYSTSATSKLDRSVDDLLGQRHANLNVPLPKACGAQWAKDGRLICFFPHKVEKKPWTDGATTAVGRPAKVPRILEGFGYMPEHASRSRRRAFSSSSSSSSSSIKSSLDSVSSAELSSLSRSVATHVLTDSDLTNDDPSVRKTQSFGVSSKSGIVALMTHKQMSSNMFISMHNFEDTLPAKKNLAEGYIVFGKGTVVCTHNAAVAQSCGYKDLATLWELLGCILADNVPLNVVESLSSRGDTILVIAKRALIRVKRNDSGLDLAYDDGQKDEEDRCVQGRLKWGRHPCSAWLLNML